MPTFFMKKRSLKTRSLPSVQRHAPRREETQHQKYLIKWFESRYPQYAKLLVAIRNEGKRKVGGHIEAKQMGLKSGFPDLFLFIPRGTYHGLSLEMKSENGVVRPNQQEYKILLKEQGYAAFICFNYREAADILTSYLDNALIDLGS